VSRDDLTVRQRAVLFALLGEARQVSNPELEALIGFRLDGKERRNLNDRKLVESTMVGRAFAHELSDAGWRWCGDTCCSGPCNGDKCAVLCLSGTVCGRACCEYGCADAKTSK